MFLSEAEEIFGYWQEHPPTYQLVGLIARMLGWDGPSAHEGDSDLADLSAELSPEEAAELGRAAGLPPPVVSLDTMREKNRQKMLEIARQNAEVEAEKKAG